MSFMTAVAHTLISLPFGVYLQSPVIIFLVTFSVHLLLDTLLHWNLYPHVLGRAFRPLAVLDGLTALLISWLLLGNDFFTLPVLTAIVGGNLPDVMHLSWDMLREETRRKYFSFLIPAFTFHSNLQLETSSFWRGIVWQGILSLAAVIAIINYY